MRQLITLLCAGVMGTASAFAQTTQTIETTPLPAPATPASGQPVIDACPPAQEACSRFHAEVELLLRWFKPVCASVPIVSTGNTGVLGQPGTVVVVGGVPPHKFEFPMTPGIQLTLGWDRGDGAVGWEVAGFLMERASNSQHFSADANGSPGSFLPYQAPDNTYQALPFTVPGVVTGGSTAVGSTDVWGIESNLDLPFTIERGTCTFYGKVLVGGRYLDLTDRVHITNTLRLVNDPSALAIGSDQFSTHNQFAGPQVGSTFGLAWNKLSVEMTTKFAAGLTHQTRNIDGSPLLFASVVNPQLLPGPLQALASNIGHERANRVTLVPELSFKSRLAVTSWCSLTLGYSLLYWNKVLCPGDQMSPLVNITQLPFQGPVSGPLDPKPQFNHTDYFAQGLDLGIEFRF